MVIGFNKQFIEPILTGDKVHTLRDDKTDRWQAGKVMHMATGVRTKYYNCFKETPCTNTQETVLRLQNGVLSVTIAGYKLNTTELSRFIKRDGFACKGDFIKWFFPDGSGISFKKLIHWTELTYESGFAERTFPIL